MAPRLPLDPVTPSRKASDAYDLWFVEFSNCYSLNLRRPPPDLSPEKKRRLPDYSEIRFYERMKYHYWTPGNRETLERTFDQCVRDVHNKWVSKPQGEAGVTPFPLHLPRVTTENERTQLLDLLNAILDDLPGPKRSSSHLSRPGTPSSTTSYPRFNVPLSPTPYKPRSKRSSEEGLIQSPTPKRSRSVTTTSEEEVPPSEVSDLDRGPVRLETPLPLQPLNLHPRPIGPRPTGSRPTESFYGLGTSVNSSKSTFVSTVFSERDEPLQLSQDTQVTNEASTQEKRRLPSAPDSDSLAPSSSTEHALNISFDNHQQELQQNVRELLLSSKASTSSYSDFSIPPDHSIIQEANRQEAPGVPDSAHDDAPRNIQAPKGLKRLEQMWRELKSLIMICALTKVDCCLAVLPSHFDHAPFSIRWEVLRIALHCGITMEDLRLQYDPTWHEYDSLWTRFRALPIFEGKSFPERSPAGAWAAALTGSGRPDEVVVFSATLSLNTSPNGPLYHLQLNPLKLDLPHRLDRRFGCDRFVELSMPSVRSSTLGDDSLNILSHWLVQEPHILLGRKWSPFYIRNVSPKKVAHQDDTLLPDVKPEAKATPQERIYMFAEDGNDFHHPSRSGSTYPPRPEPHSKHTRLTKGQLLDWLLQIPKNEEKTLLKLFSRIQLGLSRTNPTIVLSPGQIRQRTEDILSPTDRVMNDGIARMSPALCRQIRDAMGLVDVPTAYQGRFGSAKGMWIRDHTEVTDAIWIETFPSQRKWVCDSHDEEHLTFEVRNFVKELKPANLNLQLLPILEDRAPDRLAMKDQIGNFLKESLLKEIGEQETAMQDRHAFRDWADKNSSNSNRRKERLRFGHIPYLGGLPISREDQVTFLLDSGFDPSELLFLQEMALDWRTKKCEELQTRLNVTVARSTYAYMVVDFSGILAPDEVHIGFSSKFSDDFLETFVHGMDILVARAPAHFASDIQRVKAVFKPELGSLKDVVIFPTTGNDPLADKLSGGDYDGDIAWICWDQRVVANFENAQVPSMPDLFKQGILSKQTVLYKDLAPRGSEDVTSQFLQAAFSFNLQQNLLGVCTNYKEKLCYARGSVGDDCAVLLSTLISNLVDRAKQGIVFAEKDWAQLRQHLNAQQPDSLRSKKRMEPLPPRYKGKNWTERTVPVHIIDYVKFHIGKPTVEAELKRLRSFQQTHKAEHFDKDLVKCYQDFEKLKQADKERKTTRGGAAADTTWGVILEDLNRDIDRIQQEWKIQMSRGSVTFEMAVASVHEKWKAISLTKRNKSRAASALLNAFPDDPFGIWNLLKASLCFKKYYREKFIWYIAGRQLGFMKSRARGAATGVYPTVVDSFMYAAFKADSKYIRALCAQNAGRQIPMIEEEVEEDDGRDEDV
ncbi:RNA dependent RNA polymerase-domain-containing protein [Xylariomycetidae sp. FL2044]|nr:RNA dependent RNA polymerase-domain-containing protein [Xylariomycetidae sp. FL2044]